MSLSRDIIRYVHLAAQYNDIRSKFANDSENEAYIKESNKLYNMTYGAWVKIPIVVRDLFEHKCRTVAHDHNIAVVVDEMFKEAQLHEDDYAYPGD